MAGFRTPLDAYREDLARANGRTRLGADDEYWIILATGLRRLVQAPEKARSATAHRLAAALASLEQFGDHREPRSSSRAGLARTGRPGAVGEALARFPALESASALIAQMRGTVADAEEAGALFLAREILTDLQTLLPNAPPLDRGLVLIQLGRIARTLGELDVAQDMYRAAGDLGRTTGAKELEAREAVALAALARTRGNHPAARDLFQRGADEAGALGLADLGGLAHTGLMIELAEIGDFDAALRHGWQALSAARAHGSREAETLSNLAQLCAEAGYDAAALGAFTAVLARTTLTRLRLPTLGGIAGAAARLGDRARVSEAERSLEKEGSDAFPFETARAWLSVSRGQRMLGDQAAANAAAEKAAAIARVHGFHEITHHAEHETRRAQATLSRDGLEVIKRLETWSDTELSTLPINSVSTAL